MNRSSKLVNFTCSWRCEQDLHIVSSYSINKETLDCDGEEDPSPEESVNLSSTTPCLCHKPSNHEVLEIKCQCNAEQNVSIKEFSVLSEARTVEVYSELDGYLKTVRGYKIQSDKHDNTNSTTSIFCCKTKIAEPVDTIVIKFLGIKDRETVNIFRLHFYVYQNETTQKVAGFIDMDKVRGYLHCMGHSAPESGTRLLHAVENYQQTQMSGFGGLQSGLGNGSNQFGLLAGLMSLVNRPSSEKNVSSDHCEKLDRKSSIKEPEETSAQDDGVLSNMLMSISRSQDEGQDDLGGQGQMFSMLQNICGKVGKMRINEQTNRDQASANEQDKPEDTSSEPVDMKSVEDSAHGKPGPELESIQQVMEQTVSQMIKTSEQNIKEYIETRLTAMESRISRKLDNLMTLLEKKKEEPS